MSSEALDLQRDDTNSSTRVLQVTLRVDVSDLSLLFQGYFSESVMYYGYYCNYTLQQTCRDHVRGPNVSLSNTTGANCVSKPHSYNMPLAYFFTIGGAFFITCIILVYRYSLKKTKNKRALKTQTVPAGPFFSRCSTCKFPTACPSRSGRASESTSLTASWP